VNRVHLTREGERDVYLRVTRVQSEGAIVNRDVHCALDATIYRVKQLPVAAHQYLSTLVDKDAMLTGG
jgi:hypothetical protein